MTTSESTDDTRRDADRTGGRLPQSDLTSSGASKPSVSASPSVAGSSPATKSSSAGRAGTGQQSAGSSRPKTETTPAHDGHAHDGRDRSSDAKTSSRGDRSGSDRSADAPSSSHGERSESRSADGSRDESSRSSTGRDDRMWESVRSLISCVDQLVREIPRGAAARFDGIVDELGKARKALERGTAKPGSTLSGVRTEGSKSSSPASNGVDGVNGGGSGRVDRSDEIRPSATPPTHAGL